MHRKVLKIVVVEQIKILEQADLAEKRQDLMDIKEQYEFSCENLPEGDN